MINRLKGKSLSIILKFQTKCSYHAHAMAKILLNERKGVSSTVKQYKRSFRDRYISISYLLLKFHVIDRLARPLRHV